MSSADDQDRGRPFGVSADGAPDGASGDRDRIVELSNRLRRSAHRRVGTGTADVRNMDPRPEAPGDAETEPGAFPDLGITHLPGADSIGSSPPRGDQPEVPPVVPERAPLAAEPGRADDTALTEGADPPDPSEVVEQWRASIEERERAEANRDPFGGAPEAKAEEGDTRPKRPSRLTQFVDYAIYAAVFIAAITAFLMSADRDVSQEAASPEETATVGAELNETASAAGGADLPVGPTVRTPIDLEAVGPRMSRIAEVQGGTPAAPSKAAPATGVDDTIAAAAAVSGAENADVAAGRVASDEVSPELSFGDLDSSASETGPLTMTMAPEPVPAGPAADAERLGDMPAVETAGDPSLGAADPSAASAANPRATSQSGAIDLALLPPDPSLRTGASSVEASDSPPATAQPEVSLRATLAPPSTRELQETISERNWVRIRPGLFVPHLHAREGFLASRGAGLGELARIEPVRLSAAGLAGMELPDPRGLAHDEALLALDGQSVESIKRVLASNGFPAGSDDAEVDSATRSALAQWQASVGLPVTGFFDGQTVDALAALPEPQTEAEANRTAARQAAEARRRAARTAPAESPIPPRAEVTEPEPAADGCKRTASGALVPGQSLGCDVRGLFTEFSDESLTPERQQKIEEIVNEAGADR